MDIICTDIAKRFRKEVLFKQFSYQFNQGNSYAILGPNSSGKSTLLKILGGVMDVNRGKINWNHNNKDIPTQECYQFISFSSPELQLLDEFTVSDIFDLHFNLKTPKIVIDKMIEAAELNKFKDKTFQDLSSGLKNKLKLSLALFTKSDVLLLDEPCTNFDKANIAWYQSVIEEYCQGQLIIVASNDQNEYSFCEHLIHLEQYKN